MAQQDYTNHRRYVAGFHIVLTTFLLAVFVLAVINLVRCFPAEGSGWLYSGLLPLLVSISFILMFVYVRQFPLSVQDRLILTEENFRHYQLTGKKLDGRLTKSQIIALRFAPDEEFLPLATQAADQGMQPDEIKKSIKQWKADHNRA